MTAKNIICAGFGSLMVVLGTLGIFLPLLPTTPFLLLAAYLFSRSSKRWHDWLVNHKNLGPYIHAWRNKNGLTKAQKIRIAASFSVVMSISIYFSPMPSIRYFLGGIWAFWMFMLLRQKTIAEPIASTTADKTGACTSGACTSGAETVGSGLA